ncbi:cell division ATP-binding protein FtsE [Carnobacterium iners]|uniref:Cell division ATP-binding protein FtsE n=1 Tax=Carnobacterium iners TaxID=1073423 RepID=A0A1X7N155_9LACT|nr:cell division ATP-binding protein FtsE [Carnobacterium iners]SMH31017.1 cell division ATP-binding protein FtsE [Carnobacterium iners]
MIKMENVGKTYPKGVKALRDMSVSIEAGEFVYIIGASGSGKSTFAKLIIREEKMTKGKMTVCGFDLAKIKSKDIPKLRRQIGVVFQDYRLLKNRTVFENISYALEVIGTNPEEIKARVIEVLIQVELEDKADQKPTELSGGEQQRVGIARAIANKPKVLIADEPTGNLDPKTALEIMRLFYRINLTGTTIIMVTHNLAIVNKVHNRVIEIKNGALVDDKCKNNGSLQYDYSSGDYIFI